ncbi:MAG: type II CRISPR RNA-guided endonuclease Cas9 [Flavobacteriales bacterium]|nr:type II CRISPR RNA-guided endonuclease Cas9 [Flavobacteriales bacterium]
MKNILGLDLGTTSIGFAHVIEGETPEQTSIERIGVRIIQYDNFSKVDKSGKVSESKSPEQDFASGRGLSPNAGRTQKRGARRNLDRYQLRRDNLIDALTQSGIIADETILAEDGKRTTHETWRLRANAARRKIEKGELARVLLAINKKRGYKSSRKSKNEDEGQAIDGMAVAKRLYEEDLTPGQLTYLLLKDDKKYIPDFYRSDLKSEFDKTWNCQKMFYPEVFTDAFYKELQGKGQRATSAAFWGKYQFNTAENKGNREEKRLKAYEWRSKSVSEKLEKEEAAYVITEINNNLNNSSGYLGAISDRSKELYFNKETIGQYLYEQLQKNPHTRLKNQVFYRQDYLDEFEAIWTEQSKYHPELTNELKHEIRDISIFYQRKLKSQKGLISFCELENNEIEVQKNGKIFTRTIGLRVTPKSSPLFQEFKIWQILNNILIKKKGNKKRSAKATTVNEAEIFPLDLTAKQTLFDELNLKGNLTASKVIELLGYKSSDWELNYTIIEGNRTGKALYEAYLKILDLEGYDVKDLLKIKSNKDEVELDDLNVSAIEIKQMVKAIFETLSINVAILDFDAELDGKAFEQQASYQLWHLLYSYEGDNSASGNIKLYELLENKFGFKREYGRILANVAFQDDYGDLSAKAIRKIYPFSKENKYSEACELAGYRHSAASLTREEVVNRPLKTKLDLLKKNSLRNPVVEKILNQMVNVVNALIETNSQKDKNGKIIEYFKFDEIRIELARELKKNAKEREEMTTNINAAKIAHEKIVKILQSEFNIKNPSRNDIIRYKLYEELKNNGYKDLYSDTYIPREILFSKQIDVDHIIPQARLFDDSFSNKTLAYRQDNLKKGNRTAMDYIESEYGNEETERFLQRIQTLYDLVKKNSEEGITKAKFQKLQKREAEIGDGFIERDLRDSQYIAKKAKNMLFEIVRSVVSTSGSITDRLREDWGLVNIMQELNFEKYRALGLTENVEKKDGTFKERITNWTKRNDHRHHAMDALTVAFTKHNHIQYLNYLNARHNEAHKEHQSIKTIEENETHWKYDDEGNKKRIFNIPIPNFREYAKEHLENVLVSHKAKNKVVTRNKNETKSMNGRKVKKELTPRGQLHKETIYGKIKVPVIKEEIIGAKFNLETVNTVTNPMFKQLLLQRLAENGNDPKKAFGGKNTLSKTPIYLNNEKTGTLPDKVKLIRFEDDYTIRKDVSPDLKIDKVIDCAAKRALEQRLKEYNNDPKKAFVDLDKNPIWLNKDKGISIKRVTISGVKNVVSLHNKKDHLGHAILNDNGNIIPVDFVSTGNNHHVAIYCDENENLQERVVSLFEAVQLVNAGLPVIDKTYNQHLGWTFLFTMKQNEYFVFPNEKTDFNPNDIDLLDPSNNSLISQNLFRVQKLATKNYMYRHHLETSVEEQIELVNVAYKNIRSTGHLKNILKVRINHIGQIISVGEY